MTLDMHNRCASFTSFATFDWCTYWIRLDCNKKTTLESCADDVNRGGCCGQSSKTKYPLNVTITNDFSMLYFTVNLTVTDASTDKFCFFSHPALLTAVDRKSIIFPGLDALLDNMWKGGKKGSSSRQSTVLFHSLSSDFSDEVKHCLKTDLFFF